MKDRLEPLPYAYDALEPYISAETLRIHYDKHHKGYFEKLKKLLAESPEQDRDLEWLIKTSSGPIFNNAAQVWNHSFYWRSMASNTGGAPPRGGDVHTALVKSFDSVESFRARFEKLAVTELFGSGYVWLWFDAAKRCLVLDWMKDADNPLRNGGVPLLCLDMWEHAYYLDHQNEKEKYVHTFLDRLLNWEFVEQNLAEVGAASR